MVPGCFQALPVPKCLSWKGKHTPGTDGFLPDLLSFSYYSFNPYLTLLSDVPKNFPREHPHNSQVPLLHRLLFWSIFHFHLHSDCKLCAGVLLLQLTPSSLYPPRLVSKGLCYSGSIDTMYLMRPRKTQREDVRPQEVNFRWANWWTWERQWVRNLLLTATTLFTTLILITDTMATSCISWHSLQHGQLLQTILLNLWYFLWQRLSPAELPGKAVHSWSVVENITTLKTPLGELCFYTESASVTKRPILFEMHTCTTPIHRRCASVPEGK